MQILIYSVRYLLIFCFFCLSLSACSTTSKPSPKSLSQPYNCSQDTSKQNTSKQNAQIVTSNILSQTDTCDSNIQDISNDLSSQTDSQSDIDQALDLCQASQEFWQRGELDNAIQALDQAYWAILNIDPTDTSKEGAQQKDDIRFMISKRILEIYASRNTVVNGNYNAIPLTLNNHVKNEIDRLTGIERNFFIRSLKRSAKYRVKIVKALQKAGLPVELSWLPLIESGFQVTALSKARALGLWQFIPSTGYKFGLERNMFIDERLDPDKSTIAAIAYLKELHQIFGDWTSVLAAYNCGEGRVLRIIRNQNINYLDNFWDLYNKLPLETARYVPRFLATLHIINNLKKYGLQDMESYINTDKSLQYETVNINKKVYLKNIAKHLNVPLKTLIELNPELRYQILPNEQYGLKVPPGKEKILLATIDQIKSSNLPNKSFAYHRVRSGETLSTIARRYKTSITNIVRANNIHRSNYIVAGKILKIPYKGKYIPSKKSRSAKLKYRQAKKHVVKKGDSLWTIAKAYGTTTKKIKNLNNLKSSRLSIGQVLRIKTARKTTVSKDPNNIYLVKKGDSPFTIAARHNMNVKRLLKLNRLTSKSKIYPGQTLYIE